MSIKFRGGARIQRGKGIGGILRALGGIFKPFVKNLGSTFVKAANSSTGKAIGEALKEQALTSVAHLSAEALRGNDLKKSLADEVLFARENAAHNIDNLITSRRKRKSPSVKVKKKVEKDANEYKKYKNKVTKKDPF